jgi:hypothetical protein
MSDELRAERHDGILVITMNRPQARNALNAALAHRVAAALNELENDNALTVGILTGAGGTFSAGMDLKAFPAGETPMIGDRGLAGITTTPPTKPVIAAVEGYALETPEGADGAGVRFSRCPGGCAGVRGEACSGVAGRVNPREQAGYAKSGDSSSCGGPVRRLLLRNRDSRGERGAIWRRSRKARRNSATGASYGG